jgi:phasin family protein
MVTSKKAAPKTTSAGATSESASPAAAFGDLGKLIEKFKLPGVDLAAIVEAQRKDMEALAEANRQAYEGMQALARRRNEILQEALSQWQAALQDATGKDALKKQTERARKGVEQAVANFRELAEMEAASRKKAWKVVQDRFEENLGNLKKLLQPR